MIKCNNCDMTERPHVLDIQQFLHLLPLLSNHFKSWELPSQGGDNAKLSRSEETHWNLSQFTSRERTRLSAWVCRSSFPVFSTMPRSPPDQIALTISPALESTYKTSTAYQTFRIVFSIIIGGAFYETDDFTPVSYGDAAGKDPGDNGGGGGARHPEQRKLTCASQLESLRNQHLQPPRHQFLKRLSLRWLKHDLRAQVAASQWKWMKPRKFVYRKMRQGCAVYAVYTWQPGAPQKKVALSYKSWMLPPHISN